MCLMLESKAQDVSYSQFYFAPVYLNPALAGCGKNNMRLTANAKLQWNKLYKPFKYISGAFDLSQYDNSLRNIFNFALTADHSSKGQLYNTRIGAVVGRSFGTSNEICSDWMLSLALHAGYTFSNVNTKDLLFIDQLDQNGVTGDLSNVDLFAKGTGKNYFDMGAGAVYNYKDFLFGLAVQHLNEPNLSFNGDPADGELNKKVTAHVSWIKDGESIKFKPTVIAQFQGTASIFTMGGIFDFKEFPIEISCWYRNNTNVSYNNAFTIGFTWRWNQGRAAYSNNNDFGGKMGVSYDAEINKPGIGTTFGSMEFGFQKDISVDDNSRCPSATSGECGYRFPWEFF